MQNGCETKARAGLFIPSTLNGSNCEEDSGRIDHAKLEQNLSDAIDVYVSRVNGAPCGDTAIKLFRGEKSVQNEQLREHFQVYNKKKERHNLKTEHPNAYALITKVLDIK